jgi:hypothetical protein
MSDGQAQARPATYHHHLVSPERDVGSREAPGNSQSAPVPPPLPGSLCPTPVVDQRLLALLMARGTWPADRADHASFVLHHALAYCNGDKALLERAIIEWVQPGVAPWQFLHRMTQAKMCGRLDVQPERRSS